MDIKLVKSVLHRYYKLRNLINYFIAQTCHRTMGYPCFLDHLYFMNMFKNIYSIQEKLGALYSAEFDTRCWEVNNIM